MFDDGVTREDDGHLRAAIELAGRARANGNEPFGALLVDGDGTVVLEAENSVVTGRDYTGHAETNLMRMAAERFAQANVAYLGAVAWKKVVLSGSRVVVSISSRPLETSVQHMRGYAQREASVRDRVVGADMR